MTPIGPGRRTRALLTGALALAAGSAPASPLQDAVAAAVRETQAEFIQPALRDEQLAVSVADLRGADPVRASWRGGERFYPASVIKLFYLAALHHWLETGRITDSAELQRARRDMIVESSNDATNHLVDVLTGTTGGPELPSAELAAWSERRGAVTRHFESLGYRNVNAKRKTWGDGPYGREKQDMEAHPPARNFLSTDDTARLLEEMATGRCVTPARSAEMLALLAREPFATGAEPDGQATAFTGAALTPGMKLWSKAGWVSWARHDAAIIGLPDGGRIVVVVFTDGREHANNRAIIPALVRRILARLPAVAKRGQTSTLAVQRRLACRTRESPDCKGRGLTPSLPRQAIRRRMKRAKTSGRPVSGSGVAVAWDIGRRRPGPGAG